MRLTLEPLAVERDLPLLHAWVTHPRSVFWEMQGATLEEVAREYDAITADPHHHAWLGRADGVPQFLAETYDPRHGPLAGLPEVVAGDLGMHVLVAPPSAHRPGFTTDVFRAVMDFCFDDPAVQRVVVEPDVRNEKIATINAGAGFVVEREVDLGHKTAALSSCTRSAYAAARLGAPA
ncbi:acetyltransferase [Nocardioides sp. JQ2195]|uniref:GNAT family N-acetyltransferase n=1 Tax=Nocardioides sp. JQ2195 TaxID=2592334 RepID=UPI00143E2DD5|nr:GNAT family N-acetyltransferase [Nocardioides sp. JQ2195]QIX28374.1 acetyltransferase [Nocardioides sp. JQ2195]